MNSYEKHVYKYWMVMPGLLIYLIIFGLPTFLSFYFSLTRWNLISTTFIGLENFKTFFSQTNLRTALGNTFIYAFSTSLSKVIFGLFIAAGLCGKLKTSGYLKSIIYFPTLLGFVVVGIAFSSLMHPSGIINQGLAFFGISKVRWLINPDIALFSVILVDFWKGIGVTTVIYIAGLRAISPDYYEAAKIDGASRVQTFRFITLPMIISSINTVLTLSLIGGLKSYELILTMTEGGPGFSTEVLGLVVYRLFGQGMYGLATAGSVILFISISFIIFPLNHFVAKREVEL
ncbi:sugar ABC transporter permease [uncultured Sphaerochaeta sp.]|uniref:carbohydrate ABC transporter permease n=1 Tax=uncultured Sphaerochaeta sp. TaxID=886478 RepID=UPI002A0A65FD|nr:sugar ABC transporter permease [uncultured Sphaerochaeta sp.]